MENNAYSSQDWKNYKIYNSARAKITDYYGFPNYAENEQFYQSIGVSYEMYGLYVSSKYVFTSEQSIDKLDKIAQYAQQLNDEDNYNHLFNKIVDTIHETLIQSFDFYQNAILGISIILYISLSLYLYKNKRNRPLIMVGGVFVLREIMFFYLLYKGRFKPRNLECFLYFDISILLGIFLNELKFYIRTINLSRTIKKCILSFIVLNTFIIMSVNYNERQEYVPDPLVAYCAAHLDNSYVLGGHFSIDKNFYLHTNVTFMNYISLMGWGANSELYLEKKKNFHLNDIYQDLINNNNTYYIVTSNSDFDWVTEYYNSKGIAVDYRMIDEVYYMDNKQSMKIYKFIKL